jgi:hypothetical protein
MSNAIMEGRDVSAGIVEIRAEDGEVLAALSFSEAFNRED